MLYACRYFIALLLCLSTVSSYAQLPMPSSPVYKHYNPENSGLPAVLIYKIFSDDNGYLWLTTDKGVIRYDYKNFTTISTGSDRDFPVAMKTQKGLLLLLGFTGYSKGIDLRTQNVLNTDSLLGLGRIARQGQPYMLAHEYNGRIELSRKDTSSPTSIIKGNGQVSQEKNSVFAQHLMDRYGIAEGQFGLSVARLGYLKMRSPYAIQCKGDYLIVINRIFLKEKGKPVRLFFDGAAIDNTSEILGFVRSGDDLWIGYLNGKGLVRYLDHFKPGGHPKTEITLLREQITDVVSDYQNNIWVSTYSNGLYCFKYSDLHTLHYPCNPLNDNKGITMIESDENRTVIGYTNSTLELFDS